MISVSNSADDGTVGRDQAPTESNHNSQFFASKATKVERSILNYELILKEHWGYDGFRGIQREIIESIGEGRDTLGLMPTGGGKSICFQVPALAQEGVCVVITPLIALMKDQVQHLRSRHIKAAAIYTGMQHDDIVQILENAIFGGVKFLYVSPERLSSELFRTKLRHMKVCFICVDEAHCISQWGYDFRPSYLEIAQIRKDLPGVPVLALTATATPEVIDDIQNRLGFKEKRVFRMSFERKNLTYVVRDTPDKDCELVHILNRVPGTAIVYAGSRQGTKEVAEMLSHNDISATFFHAGLDHAVKDQRQKDWQEGRVRVMVATNAFGMGIDKPDVRLVAHYDCPSSIEAYFQEAGRGGRDGKRSYAVLLCDGHDAAKLHKRISDTFPSKDFIRQVYDSLAYFYQIGVGAGYRAAFEFPVDKFCTTYHLPQFMTNSALHILDRAGYIEYVEEQDCQARVMFLLERDELYRLQGNTPDEDRIIIALLRNYSGLFCDFVYIDEALIAQETTLTLPQVYLTLKSLAGKHILRFIPQKRTPFIRYRQRREDSKDLFIGPEVYEQLRDRFAQRIEAMVSYITTGNQCRSRQLLHYFGEENTKDCGQCDVCQQNKRPADQRSRILQWLGDGKQHALSELQNSNLAHDALMAAIERLLEDGVVTDDDGLLSLA